MSLSHPQRCLSLSESCQQLSHFMIMKSGKWTSKLHSLVDLPDDQRTIENIWIFNKKTDVDGNVTVYKAQLVAKGFRQVQEVDYDDIFSLVVMFKSVRIKFAIATFFKIWQMDVKTVFLNDFLKKSCI